MKGKGKISLTVCPDNSIFKQAFSDKISSDNKEKLIDHVSTCNICIKKFEIMKQLSNELEQKKEMLPKEGLSKDEEQKLKLFAKSEVEKSGQKAYRRNLFGPIPKPLYISTALIAVMIISALLIPNLFHKEIFREKTGDKLSLTSPIGNLKATPTDFKWNRIKGTEFYFLKIIDENLETLFMGESMTNSFTLPAEVQIQLIKGKTYIWEVSAKNDDGRIIDTQTKYFRIR